MCRVIRLTLHTMHTLLISIFMLKKIKKEEEKQKRELICGPDNLEYFTQQFKTHCPDGYDFAKALYKAGLIDGLRGTKLILNDHEPD